MSNPSKSELPQIQRKAKLTWVPIPLLKVSPLAQRELNPSRVNQIVNNFDPEQLGNPTVSARDEHFYVIDGQHRVEALRGMGWGDQQIECWTYYSLSEADEAEMFLKLNDVLTVNTFAKFKVGVQAGRADVCEIDRIVREQGLKVSQDRRPGAVSAVGTLIKIYRQTGDKNLGRTLRVIRDAYGDLGLSANVIDGIGLLLHRYNGRIDDERMVSRLGSINGGLKALLNTAERNRERTGEQRRHCVAAAAVEILNAGRDGMHLPNWWRAKDKPSTLTVAS